MKKEYDLAVLGGGPGGYVAAIRAAQLGMQVAIIEKDKLGGTCLHRGCIPSKTLLRSAEIYRQTKQAELFGIETTHTKVNFPNVQKRKNKVIGQLHAGVEALMKKGKIDVFHGHGRILGPSIFSPISGTISIEYENGEENTMLVPKNVLLATGSRPNTLEGIDPDGEYIYSSEHALDMEALPNHMLIVGGGAIGIEWASLLADFGVDVTVIEQADEILPTADHEIAGEVKKLLKQKGVSFRTSANVMSETLKIENGVSIRISMNNEVEKLQADKMLVSVGRKPNIDNIGLTNTDITIEHGFVLTNEFYQTQESHIYAIGDIVGGKQLAHVASHEGIVAVEHMANKDPLPFKSENVPVCIYSHPEVASIGFTEREALDKGFDISVGKFPFQSVGKALVHGEADGFAKIVTDKQTEDILGVHLVGPHVTDMISEASLAKFLDATAWEISKSIHPHPSLSEVIGEAALAVEGKHIHG